ncbi:PilZ domain-containing protein [Geothrix sp. 21YS21S-2]|uniref:PilZ domain-containing protein n=1 Tax=Geothrix sp. 21YS21S-2 TaxID=3068893 RepID=UPI0027B988C2|nr:PilZ domain-containing protein [Geothrix sp. 21YS21S-2]
MSTGAQIREPALVAEALRDLMATEAEFPIKVEGTRTLPYTAVLLKVEAGSGDLVLKLLRPLPPALAEGAPFELVFATQGKRLEGRIRFVGREGYLQYRFQGPATLTASDRRLWKRYPFRPRENFYVAGQDSEVPGHGLTGPLLSLSMGGLAFRVDRMLRLDDGMPLPPHAVLFDRGMIFSLLRVSGFPKGEHLELRGQVVRVQQADSELQLGVQFMGMGEADKLLLSRFLELRDRQSGLSSGGYRPEAGPLEVSAPARAQAPPPAPAAPGLEALGALDRRCARLLLVGPPGEDRERLEANLRAAGYWRFEAAPDLFGAHGLWKEAGSAPVRLLLVDLEPSLAGGLEAVGAVRHLEPLLRSFGELPIAFVTRKADPMLDLLGNPAYRGLSLEGTGWGELLP